MAVAAAGAFFSEDGLLLPFLEVVRRRFLAGSFCCGSAAADFVGEGFAALLARLLGLDLGELLEGVVVVVVVTFSPASSLVASAADLTGEAAEALLGDVVMAVVWSCVVWSGLVLCCVVWLLPSFVAIAVVCCVVCCGSWLMAVPRVAQKS